MVHNWKIYDLKRTIANGVVNLITYACESEHNDFSTRYIGKLEVTGNHSSPDFIPFDDLTQQVVLNWVTGSVSVSDIESANSASIVNSISASEAITEENGVPW
tara:strand:- start:132 stop:440 length:309 start_codon:yes stop_codon:yes gene_type:complete